MNYPNGIKKQFNNINKEINYKNRGMDLENDLNISNQYYIEKGIAYIYKKPTPIKVVKAEFNQNGYRVIKEAYYSEPSTTDYNGIYKGNYIDYEAKETKNKTKFPISNIHAHQIEHIKHIVKENGICFLIIRFTTINKTYLLRGIDFLNYLNKFKASSIPISFIETHGELIKDKYLPRIDYLEIVDKLWRL
ncbi:MAG: Holliday junction resolvase RecU [Bacilli bacterium]|nr:Holliday junction resolvase RecU [Bacilli bacterium]